MRPGDTATVWIPVYKTALTPQELLSLWQTTQMLRQRYRCVIAVKRSHQVFLESLAHRLGGGGRGGVEVSLMPDRVFSSVSSYCDLLLSPRFYRSFTTSHVLIAQGFSRQTMTVFFARPALTLKRFLKACQFAAWSWPVSTLPSYRLRRWYLVRVLRYHIDPTASIHTGCWVTGFRLSIGSHSVINRQCRLDARGGLSIGSNVSISPECYLISASHDPHSSSFAGSSKATSISIGDYAWLGVRAVVLPGVSIGRGAVVGAGAVVTRDVEPMAIVAGNPAHVIGQRRCEPTYRLDWRPWFDTDICS